ncbi:site-specific integrase [Pontimicrobium aquaticum]|uniref:Site-specific integrase n=1 Tax=Pontimicrobium aquaticum TaxID=2565367 RepID=A0A4U0EWS1_9FLAO|nr:site-specific integrase [Pontimicrobium aquaticum]TJY34822.1 site-specific integrase [Pontimicrobium aquaticum]
MNTHKLNILFVISSSRTRKDNRASLTCRLTYNKTRKQFSTGLFINPNNWNSKKQKVLDDAEQSEYLNTQLSLIKTKINRVFLMLQVKDETFTVIDVFRGFRGEKTVREYNTIEFFERYLKRLKKLVGIDIELGTWKKFEYVKKHVQSFIKWQYKSKDYPLKDLKLQFLNDLEYYLKTEKQLAQITINKVIQRLRKPVTIAVSEGYLDKDPFILYKAKSVRTEVVFLSVEELASLEKHEFTQPRLQFVKDLFIFCCYTGLPYNELMNLKHSNIIKSFDGNLWIKMKRKKTSKELSIPLLPKALKILASYDNEDYVFPRISNQRYNSYLKEIGAIIGIEKKLTTHMARRTFASTVLLYNDVPMEIVSELLGHSSMKITQDSYGKVVQRKISQEMGRLKGSG